MDSKKFVSLSDPSIAEPLHSLLLTSSSELSESAIELSRAVQAAGRTQTYRHGKGELAGRPCDESRQHTRATRPLGLIRTGYKTNLWIKIICTPE